MKVIIGIGNPGSIYSFNKHNAGFLLVDYFAKSNSNKFIPSKHSFYQANGEIDQARYVLIKPTTYVNKSGIAVKELIENFEISVENVLVLHDDVYLDVGSFKVKLSGGDGGHNGLSSIIYHLNTIHFPRIKIGVGKKNNTQVLKEYVLTDFDYDDEPLLKNVFKNCSYLISEFIIGGATKMLEANSKIFKD